MKLMKQEHRLKKQKGPLMTCYYFNRQPVIEEDYTDSVENLVAKAIGVDGFFS